MNVGSAPALYHPHGPIFDEWKSAGVLARKLEEREGNRKRSESAFKDIIACRDNFIKTRDKNFFHKAKS